MTSRIAHDLDSQKWRSEDIRISCEDKESEVTFSGLNLKPCVLSGLVRSGFVRPSLIQLQAIPLGRCGLDLIVQSKSGTGKTCVFVVIALEMLQSIESNATQVLIISPTREIAVQIEEVIKGLSCDSPMIKCGSAIGGTLLKDDKHKCAKCQILVGTPGRIRQLIELNLLKTNAIRLLVLDECDKLLDNNFKQQMDFVYESLPKNKQMIAVSATMNDQLAHFLSKYMRTPVFVRLNADNPALIGVKQYYQMTEFHHLNHLNFDNKIEPLVEMLKKIPFSQCLVFSNYQTRARMLCDKLNANNWPSTYISSEKCQSDRLKAMNELKKYKCRVLVSTDLTARGIDVENINLVINMDVPFDCETYLHRIGRAGRFGSRGIAITIASKGRELELLQNIIKDCKLDVEQLSSPIPDNLWNSVQTLECFSSNDNSKNEEPVDDEDCNDWNPFAYLKNPPKDSSNTWASYDSIVDDYRELKKAYRDRMENCGSQQSVDNVMDVDVLQSENCTSNIENHFSDKCSINSFSQMISKPTELVISETSDKSSLKSDSQCSSLSDNFYKPKCFSGTLDNHHSDIVNQNVFDPNSFDCNTSSVRIIQNGFNQWASALLPPISTVSNPLLYNQWINKNRYLWSYMINPFQAFELTQNANSEAFSKK